VFDRSYPYHLLYTQRGCLNSRHCKLCWWDYAYWLAGLCPPLNLFRHSIPSGAWYFAFEHRVFIRPRQIVWRQRQNDNVRLDYKFVSFHVGSCSTASRSVGHYTVLNIWFLLTMGQTKRITRYKSPKDNSPRFKVLTAVPTPCRVLGSSETTDQTKCVSRRRNPKFKVLSVVFVKNAFSGHV